MKSINLPQYVIWVLIACFLVAGFCSSAVWAQSRKESSALDSSKTSELVGVKFNLDGRVTFNQTWKVPIAWDKYDAKKINIGSSPADETPAYVFDLQGDELTVDFRNEDFKTPDGFGQGNIADPHPVTDLEAAFNRARRNILLQYRIWIGDRKEPVGIILTPYLVKMTRDGDRIVVKLTGEALKERDVRRR